MFTRKMPQDLKEKERDKQKNMVLLSGGGGGIIWPGCHYIFLIRKITIEKSLNYLTKLQLDFFIK